jgi:hypothetical protein
VSEPSKRNRAIAARRAEGATYTAIAAEFELSVRRVKEISDAVARYERGRAYLYADPLSLEGLEPTGQISPLVRKSLEAHGIWRLSAIEGMSLAELRRLSNVSKRSATTLVSLANSAVGPQTVSYKSKLPRRRSKSARLVEATRPAQQVGAFPDPQS